VFYSIAVELESIEINFEDWPHSLDCKRWQVQGAKSVIPLWVITICYVL